MSMKRFSNRQKLLILCSLLYVLFKCLNGVPDLFKDESLDYKRINSIIGSERNLTRLKELDEQIQRQIKHLEPPAKGISNLGSEVKAELKPDIGVEHRHIPIIPIGQNSLNSAVASKDVDLAQVLEDQQQKMKEEQARRRSIAGTVVVTKKLQPDYVQVYLRSRPENRERRQAFRDHFNMWQRDQAENMDWLPARYVFLVEKNEALTSEAEDFGDMVLLDKLTIYNETAKGNPSSDEIEFSLYIEQFKLAAWAGDNLGSSSFNTFTKSPHTVNLFLRDTDIVNYDTIRQAFNVLASHENKDANMVAFGGLRRDFKRHIPYTTWKIAFRADLTDAFMSAIQDQMKLDLFTRQPLEQRFVSITGTARVKVPILGIVSNRVVEAVITFPWEIPDYRPFQSEFHEWIIDHIPPNKFTSDLPANYLSTNYNWTVGLDHAPECKYNRVLSFVKTSRSNFKLRRLVRLTYQLDLRKESNEPMPALRFLLGRGTSEEDDSIQATIDAEIAKHDDIIIGQFEDTYDNLPLKTLTGYTYLAERCSEHVEWIMFHDDDALINIERAMRFFNGNPHAMNCFGFLGQQQRPHRWSKYNVTMEQWETGHYYPPFCSGPCNGISRQAAMKIYRAAKTTNSCGFRLEDVLFMGIIRQKAELPVPHFEKGICQHFDTNKERYISSKLRFYLRANRKNEEEIKKILGEFYIGPSQKRRPGPPRKGEPPPIYPPGRRR